MDVESAAISALDWPVIVGAIADQARTSLGRAAAEHLPLQTSRGDIMRLYRCVAQLDSLEQEEERRCPVSSVRDVTAILEVASDGQVLEAAELREVAHCMDALAQLEDWLTAVVESAPDLAALRAEGAVDRATARDLRDSFEPDGTLSSIRYPALGELRRRSVSLRSGIRSRLEHLLQSESMAAVLQDRFVTERGGRFVVPVKAGQNRRGLGIVHGASQSGETLFVELAEVVEPTNELRQLASEIVRTERRILATLSRRVAASVPDVRVALSAAIDVDLVCARAGFGRAVGGVIPAVKGEGRIDLRAARHPILVMRGIEVVPNDLSIAGPASGLVLTGPNTGGKTVALKTIGVAALLVRASTPIPAAEGSRVDVFPTIYGAIGDQQTVADGLSTFSAQLIALREVLEVAGAGSLVLLDEPGSGTDPEQGAALARAVAEQLVERGAGLVVTTHMAQLKALTAADSRFVAAAVALEAGEPTFRIRKGLVGESHGIATAERLRVDPRVVQRARALLDEGTRGLADLMAELETQREMNARLAEEHAAEREQIAAERAALERLRVRLEDRKARRKTELLTSFEDSLRAHEREMKSLVARLQANPNLRDTGAGLTALRALRDEVRRETTPDVAPAPSDGPTLKVGEWVFVQRFQREGQVLAVDDRGRLRVRLGQMEITAARADVRLSRRSVAKSPARVPRPSSSPHAEDDEVARLDSGVAMGAVRMDFNTADLRGMRVDGALARVEDHIDRMTRRGERVAFILHGHGTGALKNAVREWLPTAPRVSAWRPANADEGGDAFTIIVLR